MGLLEPFRTSLELRRASLAFPFNRLTSQERSKFDMLGRI